MNKKLQRQLQLAGLLKESKVQPLPFDLVREGNDGKTYVISRENSKYYIKSANTKENLQESDFDYLGGLANKGKHTSKSFESATFKLNLIFESDRENEESISLLSEKKFVLKQPKKKSKKIVEPDFTDSEEDFDFGSEDGEDEDFSFGDEDGEDGEDEDFSFGDEESGDESSEEEGEFSFGDEESDEFSSGNEFSDEESGATGDTVKDIQSLTGKLGQKVRDTEDLSSDMQKWVAKSVISALDMDSLDDGDKQDIINSLDGNDLDEGDEEEKYMEPRSVDGDELLFDTDVVDEDRPRLQQKVNPEFEPTNRPRLQQKVNPEYNPDPAMDPRTGRRKATLQQVPNPIDEDDEDDFILRASDLKRPPTDRGYFRESFHMADGTPIAVDGNHQPIMKEDHLEEKMESDDQLMTYLDIEDIIRSYDLTLGWCHSDGDSIYLDLKDGEEMLTKILIDYDGNVEIGEMSGDTFIGEPLDDLSEIDELLGIMNNELDENMMENEEAPVKTPTRTKPGTKPGEDSPFKPPMPTEDPKPKAKGDAPAPAKPKTKPGTKPGEDSPFKPPMPTEDPKPKAGDDDGVEFN